MVLFFRSFFFPQFTSRCYCDKLSDNLILFTTHSSPRGMRSHAHSRSNERTTSKRSFLSQSQRNTAFVCKLHKKAQTNTSTHSYCWTKGWNERMNKNKTIKWKEQYLLKIRNYLHRRLFVVFSFVVGVCAFFYARTRTLDCMSVYLFACMIHTEKAIKGFRDEQTTNINSIQRIDEV